MDIEQLKQMAENLHQKYGKMQDKGYGNFIGMEKMIKAGQDHNIHPVHNSSDTVKGYANGGIAGLDNEEFALTGKEPLKFDSSAGLPPPPQIAPEAPSLPVQAPNPINQYLDTQKQQLSKFGPEEQLALSNSLVKQRQSLPATGAVALGGLADTLSRVGGGNSNFMGSIQDQQNRLAGEQTGALEKAGQLNLQRTEASQKLDAQDPRSPLSQTLQKAWGSLLAQNGFTSEQVAQMPASAIAALTGQSVEQAKAKAEAQLAAASLGLNAQKAKEDVRHNIESETVAKGGLEAKQLEDKRNALKETASHWLTHPINAYKASGQLGQMGLDDSASPAAAPYGNETVKNGKTYVWHPESSKYYLKGE